jgi:hypothetical protein
MNDYKKKSPPVTHADFYKASQERFSQYLVSKSVQLAKDYTVEKE